MKTKTKNLNGYDAIYWKDRTACLKPMAGDNNIWYAGRFVKIFKGITFFAQNKQLLFHSMKLKTKELSK